MLPCCRHAGIKGPGRLTSPDQLPEVLPMAACGERFPIPADDPRVALAADAGVQLVQMGTEGALPVPTMPPCSLPAYCQFSSAALLHDLMPTVLLFAEMCTLHPASPCIHRRAGLAQSQPGTARASAGCSARATLHGAGQLPVAAAQAGALRREADATVGGVLLLCL